MHFIRAFPIVLIIILVFGSCFAFADSSWVSGNSPDLIYDIYYPLSNTNDVYITNSTDYPIFTFALQGSSSNEYRFVYYSTVPGASVTEYFFGSPSVRNLTNKVVINGEVFYAQPGHTLVQPLSIPVIQALSVTEAIAFAIGSSVPVYTSTNILNNITRFIVASNGWLSSIVGTVMANPLLIFILLFYFVGTAIGLIFRFRRN